MPWEVAYRTSLGCVEYIFRGYVTGRDLQAATTRGIALGKTHNTHQYLVDLTTVDLNSSLLDIYQMPAQQYTEQGLARNSRVAVVVPPSGKVIEYAEFYETASVNRGWDVRIFHDRAAALAWLQSPP